MSLDPFLDVFDVLLGVLEVLADILAVRVKEVRAWWLARLDRHGPRAVLNASGDVVRAGICLGRLEIHVLGTSWRVEGIERMHSLDLTSVRVHTASGLTRLDVTPDLDLSVH